MTKNLFIFVQWKKLNIEPIFNVPYSPEYNPIELVFSPFKAKFKALRARKLMGLTNEVDTTLLHQCFELDQYDNLLKPDFMDAIRKRREYLIW